MVVINTRSAYGSRAGTASLSQLVGACHFDNCCDLCLAHDPETFRVTLLINVVIVWSFLCHLAIRHMSFFVTWLCLCFFAFGLSFLAVGSPSFFHLETLPDTDHVFIRECQRLGASYLPFAQNHPVPSWRKPVDLEEFACW